VTAGHGNPSRVSTVVFQFAVEPDLAPVEGAPSWAALGRQLPRMAVQALNGEGDRGVRFFPFIGAQGGRRGFLHVPEPFPIATLAAFHQQTGAGVLVDGCMLGDTLRLRLTDAATERPLFDEELPFDPLDPIPAVERMLFEIMGALRWQGSPPALPGLRGEALAWFLVAKDDLLSLEANLVTLDLGDRVAAIRQAMRLAPADPHVRELFLELAGGLVRHGGATDLVADLVEEAVSLLDADAELLHTAGSIFELLDRRSHAIAAWCRAAAAGHTVAGTRAIALAVQCGDHLKARALCRSMLERERTPTLVGQLAAIEDRVGNIAERDALCRELAGRDDLPPTVLRLVISFLAADGRTDEALAMVREGCERHPDDLPLTLEHGRTLLLAGQGDAARRVLEACADRASGEQEREARRLIRFAEVPEMVPEMLAVEASLERGDLTGAGRLARRLARVYREQAEVWLLRGMVDQRRGRSNKAERWFRRAIERDPALADAHNRLGILLVERGKAAQGYRHLCDAVRLTPRDSGPRVHIAQACTLLGRDDEGRAHLEEAERLGASPGVIAEIRRRFFSDAG